MSVNLDEEDEQLITLQLNKLLKKFGAGKPAPGAGSGAALMGMLACNLCLTVIKLTRGKDKYSNVWLQISRMKPELEALEDKLSEAFQRDSEEWDYVVKVLLKKKEELKDSETYRRLDAQARMLKEKSTDILLEISSNCLEVLKNALDLFSVGYQSARGDTSVAARGALAGAKSALDTAYLNLKDFRSERAAGVVRGRCDALLEQLNSLQDELESKAKRLREEGISLSVVKPKSEEGAHEELPLAARSGGAAYKKEASAQEPRTVTKKRADAQSDEEVFDRLFRGKKRDTWFKRIQDFFTLKELGPFADNEDFLGYVKQRISEDRLRSAEKLTNDLLLKWYTAFKARERHEGPGL